MTHYVRKATDSCCAARSNGAINADFGPSPRAGSAQGVYMYIGGGLLLVIVLVVVFLL
jgi:hypothetical protein